jgi:hypothetical protein
MSPLRASALVLILVAAACAHAPEPAAAPAAAALPERTGAGMAIQPWMLPVANLGSKPDADWSWLLLELRPAIDTCLHETRGSTPRVLRAWAMDRGRAGMYTANGEGELFHCVATFRSQIDKIRRLPDSAPGPAPDRPVFLPAPAGERQACGERVLDRQGTLVGFLVYATC